MRRKRYIKPVDDGWVNYGGSLMAPERASRLAKNTLETSMVAEWHEDPSYDWAEQVKEKRNGR